MSTQPTILARRCTNRFPQNVGTIGLVVIAPDDGDRILFTIYPYFGDTEYALRRLLCEPNGTQRTFKGKFRPPDARASDFFLRKIPGMKDEVLIRIVRVRLSQLIRATSRGYYQMNPSPDDPVGGQGCWSRDSIMYGE